MDKISNFKPRRKAVSILFSPPKKKSLDNNLVETAKYYKICEKSKKEKKELLKHLVFPKIFLSISLSFQKRLKQKM